MLAARINAAHRIAMAMGKRPFDRISAPLAAFVQQR